MSRTGYLLDLGVMDYQMAWDLQHHLWTRRVKKELPDLLVFLEHPHVLTLGRRGDRSHLLVSPEKLAKMNIPIFHVERGGDITYHGPGQLVVYPIVDLTEYGLRLIRYIEKLEEVVLRILNDFGICGRRDSLNRGVWVDREKICSIGVAVKQRVSFHGLALNYNTDLAYFDLIHPCGLKGIRMTSMARILRREISREQLSDRVHSHFEQVFRQAWKKRHVDEVLANPDFCEDHEQDAPFSKTGTSG